MLKQDWVVTKFSGKSRHMMSTKMFAVDCEMVLCLDGTEALVRVCVVDRNLQVLRNMLIYHKVSYTNEMTGGRTIICLINTSI